MMPQIITQHYVGVGVTGNKLKCIILTFEPPFTILCMYLFKGAVVLLSTVEIFQVEVLKCCSVLFLTAGAQSV